MTPVTCCIADRQKNWLVKLLRFLQDVGRPWSPVNGIVFVLEKIRAGFPFEEVPGWERQMLGPFWCDYLKVRSV
jgi:hypothetical protein